MNNKNLIVLIAVFALAIGFATVSTVLYINGTTTVGQDTQSFVTNVIFDAASLQVSAGTTAEIDSTGRTLTFTTQQMNNVGDFATVKFKVKNYSQYNAVLGSPAVSCYFVNTYASDTTTEVTVADSQYLTVTADNALDNKTINAGGTSSDEATVTVRQVKSFVGDDTNTSTTVKYQCVINANAAESDVSSSTARPDNVATTVVGTAATPGE